jgi:hypothetical protein
MRTNGTHALPDGSLTIRGRTGNNPTVGERLTLSGQQFDFTTGRGFYGQGSVSAGRVAGQPTGSLRSATIVLEMTGSDSAGQPIYKIVTAHPS